MLLVLFAFASVTSAWFTWRHNPLYSTWSTFRFLGVVGLAIAALVAAIVAAVDLTGNLSAPVKFGSLLAVAILGALALIFIIHSLSNPKAAKLPPGVLMTRMHRNRILAWAKPTVISIMCAGALGAALPGNFKYVALSLDGSMAILAPVMLGAAYIVARGQDHALTALEHNPWIHWTYSPEQWKEWIALELDRTQAPIESNWKHEWPAISLVFGLIGVPAFLGADGSWQERSLLVLGCWALLVITYLCVRIASRRAAARRRAYLLLAPPDAFLGRDGLFCDGVFDQWLTANQYLVSASRDQGRPTSLKFLFDKIVPNGAGQTVVPLLRYVPIPAGCDADVARLQGELTALCPKARIAVG